MDAVSPKAKKLWQISAGSVLGKCFNKQTHAGQIVYLACVTHIVGWLFPNKSRWERDLAASWCYAAIKDKRGWCIMSPSAIIAIIVIVGRSIITSNSNSANWLQWQCHPILEEGLGILVVGCPREVVWRLCGNFMENNMLRKMHNWQCSSTNQNDDIEDGPGDLQYNQTELIHR